ncbi:hypothetical protein SAMN04488137_3937 [Fictibacillus solisalsi]|uniref:DinB superfamily protein n=1 Tax=Fictibacillus solisalsi TaxID=459525 RepID=A0A1H0A5J8_9BACL|nr:hypothetical protein [Fictibacillus solisalsi]SDN28838.1 hypothetical protein SAMN04488137_3937 [Fictibacillus solisalsi]
MSDLFLRSTKKMISEAFEGPPFPSNVSWFTNTEPDSGILAALSRLSAEQVSLSIHGTNLAAHADHVRYQMWGTIEFLKTGKMPEMDWKQSWMIASVDEDRWKEIQKELRDEYTRLVQTLDSALHWDETNADEALGCIAHSAYHLGAIKQMIKYITA